MNQDLHVAVQAAHKKDILTLINIFAYTRETILFPTSDAYNCSSFLQIQLVRKISASCFR